MGSWAVGYDGQTKTLCIDGVLEASAPTRISSTATVIYVGAAPAGSIGFFDAHAVASSHQFLAGLRDTDSIWEVAAGVEAARKDLAIRARESIPI